MAAAPIDLQRHLRPLMFNLAVAAVLTLLAAMLAMFRGGAGGLGLGVLIFLSAGFCGAILGFLFAVPRLLDGAGADGASNAPPKALLGGNDNVSRVSDWLSTMLIGIGLTQLTSIDAGLVRFRELLATHVNLYGTAAHPDAGALPLIGPLLLILGSVAGFLYLYLHTRIELVAGFREAEEVLTGAGADTVKAVAQAVAGGGILARELAGKAGVTVSDGLAVMQKALYDTASDGFEQTIEIGKALATTDATTRADYWFYLAAAYGQLYAKLPPGTPDADRARVRMDALHAVGRTVAIDAGYKARLRALTDPKKFDNDLAPFAADPEFLALTA